MFPIRRTHESNEDQIHLLLLVDTNDRLVQKEWMKKAAVLNRMVGENTSSINGRVISSWDFVD